MSVHVHSKGVGNGEWGMGSRKFNAPTKHVQTLRFLASLLTTNNPEINFSVTLKQSLEKSHMSPTIKKAETHVSVHSSHHTPPELLFGRFLMYIKLLAGSQSRLFGLQ